MDYLKTINLGHGKGTPGKQACWMTALSSHIGGEWTDECECVDPVINRLCVLINDSYEEDNISRTNDIMKFGLFRPLYTKGTQEDTERRSFKYMDTVFRKWIPLLMLSTQGHNLSWATEEISELSEHSPVVDILSYRKMASLFEKFPFSQMNVYTSPKAKNATILIKNHSHSINIYLISSLPNKKELIFGLLDELILCGPHAPDEPIVPVCGIPRFLELVGCNGQTSYS